MEENTINPKEGTISALNTNYKIGSTCPMCSEFNEGIIILLMCKKYGEAWRELIIERRNKNQD